jgi:hypothetical protein
MIRPAGEDAKSGKGGFHDALLVEFCDGERDVFGMLRVARVPGEDRTELMAVMFADGQVALRRLDPDAGPVPPDWTRAEVGPARAEIHTPLERWSVSYLDGDQGFDLELVATSAPIDLDDPPAAELSRVTGTHGFEQLCTVRGTATLGGRPVPIEGTGRRVRTWGAATLDAVSAVRSVYASAGGAGVTVSAVRPAGAREHDEELIAGHLVGDGLEPQPVEQVRLSTVYDADGRPREAGLELLSTGEEIPRRVAGEATCGIQLGSEGAVTWLAFFRWSVDGVPGYGSYQLLRHS